MSRTSGRRAALWRPLVVAVLGLPLLVYLGALALVLSGVRGHDLPSADAVLVLGARAYLDGRPNPCLVARVREGVALARSDPRRTLIVSGGTDREDGRNEAQVMRALAVAQGFPASRILLEPRATSTRENLRFSHALMNEHGLSRVLIVSEPFHLMRAGWLARREGLRSGTAPAPGSTCAMSVLREPLALLSNWLSGP